MPNATFYRSSFWRRLRLERLKLDNFACFVPGCPDRATHVDHIETRPHSDHPTPADTLANLRSLCAHHDAQVKELPGGRRRRDGKPIVRGVGADGMPVDKNHPWNKRR